MSERRVGLWLIGACGGVGSTTALGLAALARGLTTTTGLVTELPFFGHVDFDSFTQIILGGHEVRECTLSQAAEELHERSGVFHERLLADCAEQLAQWTGNIRPGIGYHVNPAIRGLADPKRLRLFEKPLEAITAIQADLAEFREAHRLDQVVVVNAASTEPPYASIPEHESLAALQSALAAGQDVLPTSGIYAYAAMQAGCPFVNLTPSFGANCPALEELAHQKQVPHLGRDAKTGETLLKSVLAPMFLMRNLRVLSWVGHNILGNRDGQVLNDPANKASKVKTKDALLGEMLGYKPQSLVSIEYVESLDDWKTAWDHVHFEGFLGTKMTLQFTWQGCDSLLAAPLVLDLARIALLAQRRGDAGVLTAAASFFKAPIGVSTHELSAQFALLMNYL